MHAKVLISRHRDGEINAVAAERLGVEAIRGSGTHGNDFAKKGGVFGFTELVRTLAGGHQRGHDGGCAEGFARGGARHR